MIFGREREGGVTMTRIHCETCGDYGWLLECYVPRESPLYLKPGSLVGEDKVIRETACPDCNVERGRESDE